MNVSLKYYNEFKNKRGAGKLFKISRKSMNWAKSIFQPSFFETDF